MAKKAKKAASKVVKTPEPAIPGIPTLGDRARDRLTGFTGIVMVESRWLNGCVRLQLTHEKLKGEGLQEKDGVFDIQQLELLAKDPKGLAPKPKAPAAGGGNSDEIMSFE